MFKRLKKKKASSTGVHEESITGQIFLIRGRKVMLSPHLAELYGVPTKVLVQAVRRNLERFPDDFMFQLSWEEAQSLRTQIVTLNQDEESSVHETNYSRSKIVTLKQGTNIKYQPYAFTEQGIAMLSSVLRSRRAVQVNIAIMRTFVKLKEAFASQKEILHKLSELERQVKGHEAALTEVFEAIRSLIIQEEKPKSKIGFCP